MQSRDRTQSAARRHGLMESLEQPLLGVRVVVFAGPELQVLVRLGCDDAAARCADDEFAAEQERLRDRTESHMRSRLICAGSVEEAVNALVQGVAVVNWCGERGCADAMEERLGASVLGTEARSQYLNETEGNCIICGKPGKTTLLGRAY